jgi:hypothetical protein
MLNVFKTHGCLVSCWLCLKLKMRDADSAMAHEHQQPLQQISVWLPAVTITVLVVWCGVESVAC